ncbi:MAG TPA: rhodanese-like domain-containing protein [Dehalococcoidia bacterium]|nr:rhodanese-like domain-containing protein [Dehalococcoidia bacterium]
MTAKNLCILAAVGLLIAVLVLPCACAKEEKAEGQEQKIEDIQLEEAFALMEDNRDNDDFVIIDLRSAKEYANGHIEEAVNLDYSASDFARELEELDRDMAYLLYSCTDDVSGQVLDMMAELGFTEVYNMLGGMEQWERVGLPKVQ